MSTDEKSSINNQKREIFEQDNFVSLNTACSIGNGIIIIDGAEKFQAIDLFREERPKLSFFIPASGTGSRMFKFLFDYTNDGKQTESVKKFFDNLEQFVFYKSIPLNVKEKMKSLQPQYIVEYLLNEGGMNFAKIPKGLIPFHEMDGRIYNPFQDQVLQAQRLMFKDGSVHFTIQEGFENEVLNSIENLNSSDTLDLNLSFSSQNKETDAYCFNADGSPFIENEMQLRRPAGHGSLIGNLNSIEGDYVLIKNIDNIQHLSKSSDTNVTWEITIGLLMSFKRELKLLGENYSIDALKTLNTKYQFLSEQEVNNFDSDKLKEIISRPTRVCGMVKNEGAPGGGPFWINDNGTVTKQIIEGVQISKDEDQQDILHSSSHFNPVYIALSKTDANGNELDLNDFVDHTKNMIVRKPHGGNEINYRELPGLWNGAMSNWNTLFVEIPANVFSPVKTALDLLSDAHKA